MSRFFKNLTEESSEIKRKTEVLSEKEEVAITKNEKKLKELSEKVANVQKSRTFEKSAKKLMGELKRYNSMLKKSGIPDFLTSLFQDPKFRASKQLVKEADAFLAPFNDSNDGEEEGNDDDNDESEETRVASRKTETRDQHPLANKLEKVMRIRDSDERERALKALNISTLSPEEAYMVCVSLFSMARLRNDSKDMIGALRGLLTLSGEDIDPRFFDNVGDYMDKVLSLASDDDAYSGYSSLLYDLRERRWKDVEEKEMEFRYVVLKESPKTDVVPFNILYLIRNGKWGQAKEIFEALSDDIEAKNTSVDFEGKRAYSRLWLCLITEFGLEAAKQKEYDMAFRLLAKHRTEVPGLKPLIYGLCILLVDSIAETEVFSEFLEDFKTFDANNLLLESCDKLDEVFRAFYLLNKRDYWTASKIFEKELGIQAEEKMRELVEIIIK